MNDNIKFSLDELDYLMLKVSRVHGDTHPELVNIKDCYLKIKENLSDAKEVRVILDECKRLSNNFLLPKDACSAYERVYKAFKILDEEIK